MPSSAKFLKLIIQYLKNIYSISKPINASMPLADKDRNRLGIHRTIFY